MSELTRTRIRDAAERLGLTHLPEHAGDLVARAEAGKLGYFDFLDLVLALQRRAEHVNVHGIFLASKNARIFKMFVKFATIAYAR